MGAKYSILRVTGEGEQVSAEITIPDKIAGKPVDVHAYLTEHVYRPLDIRLSESSRRLLDAMGFAKNLPPAAQIACKQTIDMIFGRAQAMAPPDQEALDRDNQAIQEAKDKALTEGVDVDALFKDNARELRPHQDDGGEG